MTETSSSSLSDFPTGLTLTFPLSSGRFLEFSIIGSLTISIVSVMALIELRTAKAGVKKLRIEGWVSPGLSWLPFCFSPFYPFFN